MKASDRLEELKSKSEESLGLERLVSLTNPKNVDLMEALVAWTCSGVSFEGDAEVPADATMDDLWGLCVSDPKRFADTAGLNITEAIPKLRQLRNLNLIFPDGDVQSKARSIIKVYVKGKIEALDSSRK